MTEEGRWHCAQHRHLAEPGDLEPFEETGRLRREQRAAEAEAIRKARERWEADTMLSEKAANGSVSAMVCLERALRPENQPPEDGEVGEAIDQILRGRVTPMRTSVE